MADTKARVDPRSANVQMRLAAAWNGSWRASTSSSTFGIDEGGHSREPCFSISASTRRSRSVRPSGRLTSPDAFLVNGSTSESVSCSVCKDSITRENRADTLVFRAAASRLAVRMISGSAVSVSFLFRMSVVDTCRTRP